jgi:hypothetical protein
MVGTTPLSPLEGVGTMVDVAFTDMLSLGGLGGQTGVTMGLDEAVAGSMEWGGVCTAGELGL